MHVQHTHTEINKIKKMTVMGYPCPVAWVWEMEVSEIVTIILLAVTFPGV